MAIYIPMRKKQEEDIWVWYEVEYEVLDPIPYLDQRGREIYNYHKKKGLFKFNKITEDIALEEQETDPYFFKKKIILIHCLATMKKCKKENFFPETTCYAA